MEKNPVPRVVLAHTFDHQKLCEHVDEIRFTETVLITGVEILEFQEGSGCSSVPVIGETHPSSFAVEIFARISGEARFRPVCAPFIYIPSSASSLDLEVIVTDHIVVRGIYSAVTLVVYGTAVRDLDPFKAEHPALVPQPPQRDFVRPLQERQVAKVVGRLVELSGVSWKARAALVGAALSKDNFDCVMSGMAQVVEELDSEDVKVDPGNERNVLHTAIAWIKDALESRFSSEMYLHDCVCGLATAQLLCLSISNCFEFIRAGGIDILIKVLHSAAAVSVKAATLALQALETSTLHAFGCEAVLGWGKQQSTKGGYAAILLALVQAPSPSVSRKAAQVLHRLRLYELASTFQATVESLLIKVTPDPVEMEKYLIKAITVLKVLNNVLHLKPGVRFPMMEFEDENVPSADNTDLSSLVNLQERRLIPSIAGFTTAISLWQGKNKAFVTMLKELFDSVEDLMLFFLSCRSGVLLLSADAEAAATISAVLNNRYCDQMLQDSAIGFVRHDIRRPVCNIEELLQNSLSAVYGLEGVGTSVTRHNEYLQKLALLSRTQTGRQALVIVLQNTEALLTIFGIMSSATATSGRLLAASYAVEILYVLLDDLSPAAWTFWIKHVAELRDALSTLKTVEDEVPEAGLLSSRLQLVADVALIYHDKGAVGILRVAASLAGESVAPISAMADELDAITLLGRVNDISGFNDSTILQLTTCMKILASVCSPSLAAALFAEGAVTVVCAVLERSAFILEDKSEVGVLAPLTTLKCVMKLVVPSLLLLSTLFQRLQLERRKYHNTKLVSLLLKLHCDISERCLSIPPYSLESGGLEARAALRLIAAVLAYWLVFDWEPVVPPRIFRSYVDALYSQHDLPLDPIETCSSLILLGNLLPAEDISSNCWDLSVEVVLGMTVIPQINWHIQTPFKEAVLEALTPHHEHLTKLIVRLAPSASEVLRGLLVHVVARISSAAPKFSAVILRQLYKQIEEGKFDTGHLSNVHIFLALCCIELVTELVKFPSSKAVAIEEGIMKIVMKSLSSFKTVESASCARALLTCVTTICDSRLSLEQCLYIIPSFKTMLEDLPLNDDFKLVIHAFYKFACSRQGKLAVLIHFLDSSKRTKHDSDPEDSKGLSEYEKPFLVVSQKLITALDNTDDPRTLLAIARAFFVGALRLAAAGRSKLGMGALNVLFGRRTDDDQVVPAVMTKLISCVNIGTDDSKCSRQVVDALQVLFNLLGRPVRLVDLLGELKVERYEKQAANHECVSFPLKHTEGVLEKLRDSFSWELSEEVMNTATRPSKRKTLTFTELSKRRCLRTPVNIGALSNSNKVSHIEEIDEDEPSTSIQQADEVGTGFEDLDAVIKVGDSPSHTISVSNSYDGHTPKDFEDDQPFGLPASTTARPTHQIFSQSLLPAPPLSSFLLARQNFQHQATEMQPPLQMPHEHYGGYHYQLGQPGQSQLQQESWTVLQQILASPEAVQELLRDQARLTRLLEQHPKLLTLLQERFSFGS